MTFLGYVTYSNVKVRKTRLFLQDTFLEVGQIDTQPFTAPKTLVSCFRVKMSEIYIDCMKKTLSTSCSLYTIHLFRIRNLFT